MSDEHRLGLIDDDDWDDERDDDWDDYDRSEPDGCCLGAACLNPHPYHLASECFDLEMAEATMGGDETAEGRS